MIIYALFNLFHKCLYCDSRNVKSMGEKWYWCLDCGERWKDE